MREKYNQIVSKMDAAWKAGDRKAYKRYRRQLEKWQLEYGAYSPIK